jgi:glycosyltransferase involved in cell wall biosynthesis
VVRNGAATLQRAAHSVFAQDVPGIEYMIVDGASTDGTMDVIRGLGDKVAVWISEPDEGISDAFNKGITLARGEVIGLLNSDDWYEPGAVRAALAAFEASGADVAYGAMQYWRGQRRTFLVCSDHRFLERGMTIGHPTVFVRRACYERFGLFRLDFRLAMDYEWLLRASVNGARFVDVRSCVANMLEGGLAERRWYSTQREVSRARALHLRRYAHPADERAAFAWAVMKGIARRGLDHIGLRSLRRLYHRYVSPVRIEDRETS